MFYCSNCDNVFDDSEVKYFHERNEFWGAAYIDRIPCCPICRSTSIKNIDGQPRCSSCGEICIHKYIQTPDEKYYCNECYLTYDIKD